MSEDVRWYVVHTYSGYENKVKANIEKIVENRGMQDLIHKVEVPVVESVEIKDGQKKTVQRKVFPSYVLVKMVMDDDTWYVVRNTRGVTSFVGPGSKPVPLTDEEVASMGFEATKEVYDISVGDAVRVAPGVPFESSIGVVNEINYSKKTVIVKLSIFGGETPVELDFTQVIRL